jgi:hypothetical protein
VTAPLPDLRAGDTDAKIRTRVGPRIRDDTPPHHRRKVTTTQAGPQFVKKNRLAGASSGDHTQITQRWRRALRIYAARLPSRRNTWPTASRLVGWTARHPVGSDIRRWWLMTGEAIRELLTPLIGKSGSISMIVSRTGHIGFVTTENE